eukprot:scaffold13221_cov123-Skeletonema_dohrnii-CCMP3373.AAC.9
MMMFVGLEWCGGKLSEINLRHSFMERTPPIFVPMDCYADLFQKSQEIAFVNRAMKVAVTLTSACARFTTEAKGARHQCDTSDGAEVEAELLVR